MSSEFTQLKAYAVALGALAAITLTTLAIITGFKDSGKVDNTTADLFKTGLTLFGTFAGILVLAIIGKTIIAMFKKSD
jgi:hypothetical protein